MVAKKIPPFKDERDLTLAEFAGVYWYVYGLLMGGRYEGMLCERVLLEYYKKYTQKNQSNREGHTRCAANGTTPDGWHKWWFDDQTYETSVPIWRIACERLGIKL